MYIYIYYAGKPTFNSPPSAAAKSKGNNNNTNTNTNNDQVQPQHPLFAGKKQNNSNSNSTNNTSNPSNNSDPNSSQKVEKMPPFDRYFVKKSVDKYFELVNRPRGPEQNIPPPRVGPTRVKEPPPDGMEIL